MSTASTTADITSSADSAARPPRRRQPFAHFASWTARASGRPATFWLAVATIVVWGATGPLFGYSDTWQLVINTGTTIVTFLMVFLIQNSQNRESAAIQIKLDEIIRALRGARNSLIDLEEMTEGDIDKVHLAFCALAEKARRSGDEELASRLQDKLAAVPLPMPQKGGAPQLRSSDATAPGEGSASARGENIR